jgi:hypothetical protein
LATESSSREGLFPASRFETVAKDRSRTVAFALAGVLLAVVVVRVLLARRIVTPWIMIDEFIYSELAKSFADRGEFLLRDASTPIYSVAYSMLIAPAWLADSVETAYGLARAINVVIMTAAVVPVYFWGRRLMSPPYAALAAVLVLLMPAYVYTGTLMTENAYFTAFLAASFAIASALERPTLPRQGLVLAAIGLTCAVRVQGLVLLPVYAAALAFKVVLDLRSPGGPRGLRYVLAELRRYLASSLALLLLAGGYVVVNVLQGAPLEKGLGAYGGVVKVEYDLENVGMWVADHFAELTLSVAVIPVSALVLLLGLSLRGWTTSAAERAFLAVAASAFVLVVVQVGAYASRFALRIEERNMVAVAPLLYLALCLWLARGMPRPVLLTAVAALGPAALLFTIPLEKLLNISILSDTFGLIPLLRLNDVLERGTGTVEVLMLVGGFSAALAFAGLPRRLAGVVLPTGVALFLLLSSWVVFGTVRDHARATLAQTGTSDSSWIDEKIGTLARAAFLYGLTGDLVGEAQIMWQTEFWNRSVGTVYRVGPPEPAPLSEQPATLDRLTGHIGLQPSRPVRYAVAPSSLELAGTLLAGDDRLSLYRTSGPLRLATLLEGVYADGWMATDAAFTHYSTSPGGPARLRIRVSREEWDGPSVPAKVTIRIGPLASRQRQPAIGTVTSSKTWTVRSRRGRSFTLATPKPPFRVEIHVGTTFSPADYGRADPRQLGAQVELGAS